MWSNLAAAWMGPEAYLGKQQAVSLRSSLERSMTPEQIAEARRLARRVEAYAVTTRGGLMQNAGGQIFR